MDLLLISPVAWNGNLVDKAVVKIAVADGPLTQIDDLAFALPDAPRPLAFTIQVSADETKVFPVTLKATYSGGGQLDITGPQEAFAPPRAAVLGNSAAMSLIVFLSRIRDATDDVAATLNGPRAKDRIGFPTPDDLRRVNSVVPRNYLNDPSIDPTSRQISFSSRLVQPAAEHVIFELLVPTAPKLIAVAWPDSVDRSDGAPPPDVLVYFHPDVGQNVQSGFYLGAYPFSFDFCYFGVVTYEWYRNDPLLADPFYKGLPFQLAAAGAQVVSVLPVNRVGPEVGVFRSADSMAEVLHEIVGFMLRRKGVTALPDLGRVGLGAFSAGNRHLTAFLRTNRSNAFCQNVLKEVYAFEPPGDAVDPWLEQATAWLATGDSADKRARIYTLADRPTGYRSFVGRAVTESAPHFATSADGRRTASVTPIAAWAKIRPGQTTGFDEGHQLVSALLLTHAASASRFRGVPSGGR